MAIRLLVVLLALGLLHLAPQLARWRGDGWFRRWVAQLGDTSGAARVAVILLLPTALCVLVVWMLGWSPLGELLRLLFALAALLYCFGPREFEADLEAILRAPDDASREAAAQALADDGNPVAWNAPALGEAVAYAALRRRFAVLLWFFLLGPVGALLYRLGQTLGRDDSLHLDPPTRRIAGHVANALDWLPAQLLTFTLAVVGHWDAVIDAWRRWHSQAAPTSWYSRGPGFLGAAARADVVIDIEAGDGYAEEHSDPLGELRRLQGALLRALLAWLSVVALVVIGSWLG
ncbi:regulatory signaling modulator protein AmpE [Rhodanobacter spathiphylli]|uniref:Membrane protein required for beta-lactamase induction n=1 Tax=Rhodanobacter spathiphylli B39 TaxID=1163407 RepID=I4W2G9_9GAMM|nr:regulatory signaling modulator protein AmpE [Rhodanobacter spathiphylli]EIL93660.1 membrane protein required for beta-lactamase induction [Rhodanobacter spathiphylli B39]